MDVWQIALIVAAIIVGGAYFWRRSQRKSKT